jgi:TonB family protein
MIAFLVDCLLKSSMVLLAACVLAAVLRRRSASVRHTLWSAALLAVVLLPAFMLVMPALRWEMNFSTLTRLSPPVTSEFSVGADASDAAAADAADSYSGFVPYLSVPLWIWLAGAAAIALVLLAEAWTLTRIAIAAKPFFDARWFECTRKLSALFRLRRSVRFAQSPTASLLVTWGAFAPKVLLPAGADRWSDHRVRAVLGHELAHVRRHDWFFQLAGEIARTVYWFNPLVWFACSRLRQESERACDDAVLGLGVDATEYASELLDLARLLKASSCPWASSLAMARPSTLERRFAAMLNPRLDRRSISRTAVLIIAAAALCVTLSLAAIQNPAQTHAGRLFGRVYDPSGAPITNAAVTIYNSGTNARLTVRSNEVGVFDFAVVPAGEYELQTSAPGFEAFRIRAVTVEANQEVNLNVMTVTAAAAAAAVNAAPGVQAPAAPSAASRPKLLRRVPPVYPAGLKEKGIGGTVMLDAVIGADGTPKNLRVANDNVDSELARAAVEAVRQWRYEPAVVNGLASEARIVIPITFTVSVPGARGQEASATTPPPPPPPPPPNPDRIRIGGNATQEKLVSQVKPVYPQAARDARISGVVILEAVIGREGNVQEVRVISGHPLLQQAAIDSVSQWRYEPTLLNGAPVEVVTTITVTFSLSQ